MSNQALNSIDLYRGNKPSTIERALSIQSESVVNELMEHFSAKTIGELAVKLSV